MSFRSNRATRDSSPTVFPAHNKNAHDASCAYSERISCRTAQKPNCGGTGGSGSGDVPRYMGIFVEAMATNISIMNGMTIKRVNKPAELQQFAQLLQD